MNTIAIATRNMQSPGFHTESLNKLTPDVHVGEEVMLDMPETHEMIRGSIVRIDPEENRCVIQILGMYTMFA